MNYGTVYECTVRACQSLTCEERVRETSRSVKIELVLISSDLIAIMRTAHTHFDCDGDDDIEC